MAKIFKKVVGTPTMMLLPARNYTFNVSDEYHSITLPRKGRYVDFDDRLFTEEDGEFDLMCNMDEEDSYVLFMPSLSKVMFATSQYPDLKNDQAFIPFTIIVRKDEIEVVGNIIQMLKEN
jgi:hypothetical protein